MTRATFREHVFKILFRYEFYNREDFIQQIQYYFSEYPDLKDKDMEEIRTRVLNIVNHVEIIDERLQEVCVGWNHNRIGKAELTILRVAIYEILFDEQIQRAISINEAVVLSKLYCDDKAHSFVNGVLAKLEK